MAWQRALGAAFSLGSVLRNRVLACRRAFRVAVWFRGVSPRFVLAVYLRGLFSRCISAVRSRGASPRFDLAVHRRAWFAVGKAARVAREAGDVTGSDPRGARVRSDGCGDVTVSVRCGDVTAAEGCGEVAVCGLLTCCISSLRFIDVLHRHSLLTRCVPAVWSRGVSPRFALAAHLRSLVSRCISAVCARCASQRFVDAEQLRGVVSLCLAAVCFRGAPSRIGDVVHRRVRSRGSVARLRRCGGMGGASLVV